MQTAQTSDSIHLRHRLALRVARGIAAIFVLVALVPYAIAGESWGMVWYPITAPFSEPLKSPLWDYGTPVYVLVTTLVAAFCWAALVYVFSRVVLRLTNVV